MAIIGFHHVAVSTPDLDRLVAYCCGHFGSAHPLDFANRRLAALRGAAG